MDTKGTGTQRQRLDEVAAALSEAQRGLEAYLGEVDTDEQDTGATHALEYEKTAALLRRRAQQAHRSEEERADLRRRAEWFARRAAVKRDGVIMPRALRTPLETLELVDDVRQVLIGLSIAFDHLAPEDLVAFRRALDSGERAAQLACPPNAIAERLTELKVAVDRTMTLLGTWRADRDGSITVVPFAMPLAESTGVRT